jgi:hypothetical protein
VTRSNRCLVQADTVTREIPAPAGGVVIETFVPWKMVRRGVRKRIVTPLGEPEAFAGEASSDAGAEDSPLLRALGLAHHWQRLLDEGRCAGLREIADAEGIDLGRSSRIMRLTQLAPAVIEAALRDGRLVVGLSELLGWFPERWDAQLKWAPTQAGCLPFRKPPR